MRDADVESVFNKRLIQDGIMRSSYSRRIFIAMARADPACCMTTHSGNGHCKVEPGAYTFVAKVIQPRLNGQLSYSQTVYESGQVCSIGKSTDLIEDYV